VLSCRSNSNKVIPAANTGKDNSNKNLETINLHKNTDICSNLIFFFALPIVTIKLIEATTEEVPAVCKEKILKSTLELLCAHLLSGG